MIYLDNAATTFPKPRGVYAAVRDAMVKYGANPGRSAHAPAVETAGAVYDVRDKLAGFFGLNKPENAVFTLNTTHALNLAINSALSSGDRVVTSVMEHNSVLRPLYAMGCEISFFEPVFDDHFATIENFRRAAKGCKAAVFSILHNVNGYKLPFERIFSACRAENLCIIADCAQCAGYYDVNMHKHGIDMLCVPGHKGLFGLCGSGALLVSEQWENKMKPLLHGGSGAMSQSREMPPFLPERLEAGTLAVVPIISMGAGIDFVTSVGIDELRYRSHIAAAYCRELLGNIRGVDIYPSFNSIVLFNIQNAQSFELENHLDSCGIALRSGFHCAPLAHKYLNTPPHGALRASFGPFNTKKDALRLAECVKKFSKKP